MKTLGKFHEDVTNILSSSSPRPWRRDSLRVAYFHGESRANIDLVVVYLNCKEHFSLDKLYWQDFPKKVYAKRKGKGKANQVSLLLLSVQLTTLIQVKRA